MKIINSGAISILSLIADCPVVLLKYIADVSLLLSMKIDVNGTQKVLARRRGLSLLQDIGLGRSYRNAFKERSRCHPSTPRLLLSVSENQTEFSYVSDVKSDVKSFMQNELLAARDLKNQNITSILG